MILGLTDDERFRRRYDRESARDVAFLNGVKRFAFFPTKLDDGRYVLWESYILKLERNYRSGVDRWGKDWHYTEERWHRLPDTKA